MRLSVEREDPRGADARSLLQARDAHFLALYGERALAGAIDLAAPNVVFLGGRLSGALVACGALVLADGYAELKRMFVRQEARGRGIGAGMLAALEAEALRLGMGRMRAEVGVLQTEARQLYHRAGYREIAPFGPYVADPLSSYIEKRLA